ncbi:MAG TPA: hypothetical protein VM492_03360, partial [Sumerlaeia bacterium]|nr:hypothetical protein [Sumerlaeia bacterium]
SQARYPSTTSEFPLGGMHPNKKGHRVVAENLNPEIAKALGAALPPAELSGSLFRVEDKAQLFVDRLLVRDSERVWFTQRAGRKHPKNPLIVADRPWEGWRVYVYGSVVHDEQESVFKMYYIAVNDSPEKQEHFRHAAVTCYAVSKDGVRWEKPSVGPLPSKNGQPHNAVVESDVFSVMRDADDPDPQRRYKAVGFDRNPPRGYYSYASSDGLHWNREKIIAPDADVITAHYDPYRKLYVAFPKEHSKHWRGHGRRLFNTIASRDFDNWSKPALSWTTDARDDLGSLARIERARPVLDRPDDLDLLRTEYYGIGAYPHESCTIGFPWVLTINNNARWGNHEGPQEIQLAVSRDLVNWERPFRTPVIEFGRLGEWDASYHTTVSSALRVGDEIWLYYGGANYTHGTPALYRENFEDGTPTGRKTKYTAGIGLAIWKLDRFVSVDAPSEGGALTTIPFVSTGKRLELNAVTGNGGEIVVELCDAAGKPLPDWPKSDPFVGDDLRHTVAFQGNASVSSLAGKPVSLRFHLKSASLYSFAFRSE